MITEVLLVIFLQYAAIVALFMLMFAILIRQLQGLNSEFF